MKRRGFLKSGAATLAASSAGPLTFTEIIAPDSENVSAKEMHQFLTDMDNAMDKISSTSGYYITKLLNQQPNEEDLLHFQAGVRSMLLVGNFNDLSIEGQVHPGVQKRLEFSAPEMTETINRSISRLKSMSPEMKEEIKTALHDEPDLGDRILNALDLEARVIGVPSRRRRQMKRMGKRITNRLKHSPDMFINEYLAKYNKLTIESNADAELEYLLKKKLGEEEFYSRYGRAENASVKWQDEGIIDKPIGYKSILNREEDQDIDQPESKNKYRKGLRALGIGAILTAVGWIFIGLTSAEGNFLTAIGVALGVTIGPLIILIALFMLLVQALKKPKG